jgi:hypothetical protein
MYTSPVALSAMQHLDQEKTMDFMTGVYLAAGLAVVLSMASVAFVAYWADQPGGVIEIGTPRWVMPKPVARAMHLQRGEKLRWTVQDDGSVRVEKA